MLYVLLKAGSNRIYAAIVIYGTHVPTEIEIVGRGKGKKLYCFHFKLDIRTQRISFNQGPHP